MNEFAKHLYENDLDGYVQIMQFVKEGKKKTVKIYNTRNDGIKEIIQEQEYKTDVFITPNTMYLPDRNANNVRQFRALYVDIDNIEGNQMYVGFQVLELASKGVIPQPSMIVNSGRGIHLYWRIKHAPYSAVYTWQNIEDMLIYRLKHLGADSSASDCSRVLRIPNTINSRNNSKAYVMFIDDSIEYSMFDLKENYLNKHKKQEIHKAKKNNSKVMKNLFFNSYNLHMTRSRDIKKLCELRNYSVKGHRNMILHCYAYWQGIYIRDREELEKDVKLLNSLFKEPLRESEVNSILRSVPKAIDKFIAYEQGIILGENKRVSKNMRNKLGYWYKNETLIEQLCITGFEMEHLETIISKEEKYRRRNKKRTPRNEEGLTKKQQESKILKERALMLKEKGWSYRMISRELKIGIGKVRYILQNEVY